MEKNPFSSLGIKDEHMFSAVKIDELMKLADTDEIPESYKLKKEHIKSGTWVFRRQM